MNWDTIDLPHASEIEHQKLEKISMQFMDITKDEFDKYINQTRTAIMRFFCNET